MKKLLWLLVFLPIFVNASTLYERYITGDDGFGVCYSNRQYGQTFTVGNTGANEEHQVTSVKMLTYRANLPGTATVGIKAVDGDHKPTGSFLCSATFNANDLTSDVAGEWKEVTFSSPATLSASTEYVLLYYTSDPDAGDTSHWRRDESSPTYGGGSAVYSTDNGSTWTVYAGTRDMMFEEWGEVAGEGRKVIPYRGSRY